MDETGNIRRVSEDMNRRWDDSKGLRIDKGRTLPQDVYTEQVCCIVSVFPNYIVYHRGVSYSNQKRMLVNHQYQ